jgi:uncharacterized membrane protein
MSAELDQLGPIDYIVVEWPGKQPSGEAAPLLIDLVDRGLIRIMDLAFMRKNEDGTIETMEIEGMAQEVEALTALVGANSDLITDEDLAETASVLDPGTSAAILIYENSWAAPFAAAVRSSGGQLVANGRIPLNSILEALDAAGANT